MPFTLTIADYFTIRPDQIPYLVPYIGSAVLALAIMVYLWQHRAVNSALHYGLVMLAQFFNVVAYIFEISSDRLPVKSFWDNVQWVTVSVTAAALLAFVLYFIERPPPHPRQLGALLAVPPLVFILLLANPLTLTWVRTDTAVLIAYPFSSFTYTFTPLTNLYSLIYLLGLPMWAIGLLVRHLFRVSAGYRPQVVTVLLGIILPVGAGILALFDVHLSFQRDMTPLVQAVSNVIVAWGLFRYQLFDLAPIAREKVFENIPDAVMVVDTQWRLVDLNPAARPLMRPAAAENGWIGQNLALLFPPWSAVLARHGRHPAAVTDELELADRFFALQLAPIHGRGSIQLGWLILLRDITENRRAQNRLIQQSHELLLAKEQAEAANHAKSDFLSNMSHELRTPLNAVLGYAQIMQREPHVTASQLDGLRIIHQSGEHLLTLINDVLDIAKIEAGKLTLNPAPFHLPSFLQSITNMMALRAQQKGLGFRYEPPAKLPEWIEADETRLRQVLINLLGNAVKFTVQGQVTLKVDMPTADLLHFSVQDTGVGIPADKMESIFLPFEQLESAAQSEGTGLGLAISKQLMGMMHGSLTLASTPGEGTVFVAELPMVQVDHPTLTTAQPHPRLIRYEGETRRILVVDDKEYNRLVLWHMLTPLGFEVVLAADGREALHLAATHQPHLVLLDLIMPVLSGFETAPRLREQLSPPPIIIAASASVFENERERSRMAGCDDFLPKPIREKELLAQLTTHMQLVWIYDEQPLTAVPTAAPILISPTDELLTPIRYQAQIGNLTAVQNLAAELAQQEQYRPFAEQIITLAQTFQTRAILDLLNT